MNKCKCISKYSFFVPLHKTYRSNFGLSFQSFAAEIHLLKVALRIDISIVPKVDFNCLISYEPKIEQPVLS